MAVLILFFALILTLLFVTVFTYGGRRYGPWDSIPVTAAVLFLLIWAGGSWIVPFGPTLGGFAWMPMFWLALLLALFFAAMTPPKRESRLPRARASAEADRSAGIALGVFFWVFAAVLVLGILIRALGPAGFYP